MTHVTRTHDNPRRAFYFSYYVGHDYYNIHFDRVVNMLQIGLAGDTSPSLIR